MTITRVTEERLPQAAAVYRKPGGNLTGTRVLRSFWSAGTAGPTWSSRWRRESGCIC